jgi:choline-glycine betaine transporter
LKNLSAAAKYFPMRINFFHYNIHMYPIWKIFILGGFFYILRKNLPIEDKYLSSMDNICLHGEIIYPGETIYILNFVSILEKKQFPLTGFEPATVLFWLQLQYLSV